MNSELISRLQVAFDACMEKAYIMVPGFRSLGTIPMNIAKLPPRTVGLATFSRLYGIYKVELNQAMVTEANEKTFIDEIIPHEIAHILTNFLYPRVKQAHGPEWKAVCRALGGNSSRTCNSLAGVTVKRNMVKRYLYKNEGGELYLTAQQHAKCQTGYAFLNKKAPGNRWRAGDFTGQVLSIQR